jgi:ATP-binding cassette, subfamily B, bacterial PglK
MIFKFNELKKIGHVIGYEFKVKFILLIILLIFSAFLEMLGISLIPMIISVVLDFDNFVKIASTFLNNFGLTSSLVVEKLNIKIFLISILIFFVIKNLIMLAIFYFEGKLEYKIKQSISNRLFNIYIRSSYENFHLKRKSSELIRNLAIEVANLSSYLNAIINLIREISVFLFLIALLLFVNLKLTFSVLMFFSIIIGIYYLLLAKKIKNSGKEYITLKEKIISRISQTIFSIKELFIYEKEALVQNKFSEDIKNYEIKIFFLNFIKKVPRIILEVSGVGLIILFILFFSKTQNNIDMITIASLVGLCAIRMIPSLNTMSNSVINIKFYKTSFDIIFNELSHKLSTNKKVNIISNNNIKQKNGEIFDTIEFKNVCYSYDDKKIIFDNFNFNVKRGEFVKIIGNSGKGKSTFLNLLTGLLQPKFGSIRLKSDNKFFESKNLKNLFSYVPQETFIFDQSIKENILFGNIEKKEFLKKCVEKANLNEFLINLPDGIETNCGERGKNLSGGQKQKIAIARALYANRDILLFDEITNNLDSENENKIIDTINKLKEKKTILFITHKDNKKLLYDKVLNLNSI